MTAARACLGVRANAHKIEELHRILDDAGLDVEVRRASTRSPTVPEVPETESTFAGNALLKARAVARPPGVPAVADDSGCASTRSTACPGSSRRAGRGRHGDDVANLELVLGQLADTPDDRLGAAVPLRRRRSCCPTAARRVVEGDDARAPSCASRAARTASATTRSSSRTARRATSAELTSAEKDAISHRGNALRALAPVLRELLPEPADH